MSYNPIEAAEALQSIDQQTLNQYMRNPPPGIPGYQVAAEVARRADMAKRFAALDAKQKTDQQTGTVIDEVMRALNPGSVNPAPANPSQLASRSIPSNITGANAPMSPPAMRPPVNAGIASGMQAQPALSPQVMQAAGGTMGRTVYARHGGVPAGEVYGAGGSDALEEALKRQRKSGARLYSKERSRSFEGDLKNPYPEQELKRLAMLASSAREENNIAHGGMGRTAFASNGTQGRTVYAQDGYVDPSIKMPNFPTRAAYEASIDPRRNEVAASEARARALQQQAEFTRRGGPDFTYPADPRASSGPEMLAAQETRQRMARFGINPDAPNAISALADAEQGQLEGRGRLEGDIMANNVSPLMGLAETPSIESAVKAVDRGVQLVDHNLGGALGEYIPKKEVRAVPRKQTSIELASGYSDALKYLTDPGAGGTAYKSAEEEFDYGNQSESEIIAIEEQDEIDRLNKLAFEDLYGDQTTGPSAGFPGPRPDVDQGGGILTDVTGGDVAEVKDASAGADARGGVVPSKVVPAPDLRVAPGDGAGSDTRTEALARQTEAETERGTITFLGPVDSDKIISDTYAALSKDSQEAFKRIEDQFDTLKDYDPRQSIQDIQAGRASRIEQIKSDTNIQRLLTASAAFLGTTTFYEGFGKAMEGMTDLSKEEQKQVLALQDKIDESDLTARAAYVEHQAKMASMENNLLAAKRADQRGNSEEASRRAALAVAERAAANDLLYKAEQLANTKAAQVISKLAYTYKKPSDAKVAMDEFITNQWRVLTPEEKVEFGWPEGATTIGQLDFNIAADKIGAYLKKVMPPSSSGGYAEINYRDRVAKDARGELEDIKTGFDKAWGTAGGADSTLDLKRIAALTGTPMPTLTEKSNMLSPLARRNTEVMAAVQDYMAWQSYRRNINNSAVVDEILRQYPKVIDIERRIGNMDRAENAGQGTGGEGDNEFDGNAYIKP